VCLILWQLFMCLWHGAAGDIKIFFSLFKSNLTWPPGGCWLMEGIMVFPPMRKTKALLLTKAFPCHQHCASITCVHMQTVYIRCQQRLAPVRLCCYLCSASMCNVCSSLSQLFHQEHHCDVCFLVSPTGSINHVAQTILHTLSLLLDLALSHHRNNVPSLNLCGDLSVWSLHGRLMPACVFCMYSGLLTLSKNMYIRLIGNLYISCVSL